MAIRAVKTRWVVLLSVALVLVGVALLRRVYRLRIREVIPGTVYRMGQPTPQSLHRAKTLLAIRSIINLRGYNPNEPWYQAEVAAARKLGLEHVDLRLENNTGWHAQHEARDFVRLFDQAQKPVLLHCEGGVDRSSWASGVTRLLAGDSVEEALFEISTARGHRCVQERCPTHRFFLLYQDWLGKTKATHSAAVFRQWLNEIYCPIPYDAELKLVDKPRMEKVAPSQSLSFRVTVVNRSPELWVQSAGERGMRLGARIIGPFPKAPLGALAMFRKPKGPARDVARAGVERGQIKPGESKVIEIGFTAPEAPGSYVLQIDMVDEMVHWFSDLGGPGLLIPFEVSSEESSILLPSGPPS